MLLFSLQRVEIEACQSRVKLLMVLLKATVDRINERKFQLWSACLYGLVNCPSCPAADKSKREEIAEDCRVRSQRHPRYESRIEKTNARLSSEWENIESRKARVVAVHKKLKSKIRANVRHIMQYIFPINTVLPPRR